LKLLFDADLSPKLVGRLQELFPGSAHVFDTGLARSTADEKIWQFAAAEGFMIVTADSDFLDLARSRGTPPKVVYLENCDYLVTPPEHFERPELFGVPVCTGPVAYQIPRARVENPDTAWQFYQTAPIGQSIALSLKPLGPVRVRAIGPELQSDIPACEPQPEMNAPGETEANSAGTQPADG
jgi:predicted nuclease of predicted toxin-antitoxin system